MVDELKPALADDTLQLSELRDVATHVLGIVVMV